MSEYRTISGYTRQEANPLTHTMEDYLEMICRLSAKSSIVRVSTLAAELHVRPSSASKMAAHLAETGYILFARYGYIRLAEKGQETGRYLLYRHEVIQRFLCMVNHSTDELRQTEKIEHFLDFRTVRNLAALCDRLVEK